MPEQTFEYRLTKIEERVAENEEKNTNAHREFYHELEELRKSREVTNERYTTLLSTVNEISRDVRALREKPIKAWDSLGTAIIGAIASCLIGGIIATLLF